MARVISTEVEHSAIELGAGLTALLHGYTNAKRIIYLRGLIVAATRNLASLNPDIADSALLNARYAVLGRGALALKEPGRMSTNDLIHTDAVVADEMLRRGRQPARRA